MSESFGRVSSKRAYLVPSRTKPWRKEVSRKLYRSATDAYQLARLITLHQIILFRLQGLISTTFRRNVVTMGFFAILESFAKLGCSFFQRIVPLLEVHEVECELVMLLLQPS